MWERRRVAGERKKGCRVTALLILLVLCHSKASESGRPDNLQPLDESEEKKGKQNFSSSFDETKQDRDTDAQ